MSYKLFLDDVRDPIHCVHYMHTKIGALNPIYLENDWVIVRNYAEFYETLNLMGMPDLVSFDHDLADEHYMSGDQGKVDYTTYKEKTGYDCAKWLVEYHQSNLDTTFPKCIYHTMNPIGYENMEKYVNNYIKTL